LISTGAAERWQCTASEVVLACASHIGDAMHVTAVSRWLERIGCREQDLQCGTHPPFSHASGEALTKAGHKAGPLHNNNSGKHTAFLSTAIYCGEPTNGYLNPAHPVQVRVRQAVERICDVDATRAPKGVERCGMPMFALPIKAVAHGMARFGAGTCLVPQTPALRRQYSLRFVRSLNF